MGQHLSNPIARDVTAYAASGSINQNLNNCHSPGVQRRAALYYAMRSAVRIDDLSIEPDSNLLCCVLPALFLSYARRELIFLASVAWEEISSLDTGLSL